MRIVAVGTKRALRPARPCNVSFPSSDWRYCCRPHCRHLRSHLFFAQIRNFGVDDEHLTERFRKDSRAVFEEDVVIMEAQQRATEARPDAPVVNIRSDAPQLAMRQLVRKFMEEEKQ